MTPVLSTHLFVGHRLTTAWLERVWHTGFTQVEIFCARQHLDYRNKAQIGELRYWFRDSQLKVHALHSPMYNDDVWGRSGPQSVLDITESTKVKRIAVVDEIKRALEIAEDIPFRYFIQHIGVAEQEYDERRMDAALSSLEEIKVFGGQRGVEVLLENTPNDLSTAERLTYFLSETHLNLGFCFDVGHAHMTGRLPEQFELMKDRIRSVHVHDNHGQADEHCFPGEGTIDFAKTMRLLQSAPNDPALVLELKEPRQNENMLGRAYDIAQRLSEKS